MKPNPFALLNHFTLPFNRDILRPSVLFTGGAVLRAYRFLGPRFNQHQLCHDVWITQTPGELMILGPNAVASNVLKQKYGKAFFILFQSECLLSRKLTRKATYRYPPARFKQQFCPAPGTAPALEPVQCSHC